MGLFDTIYFDEAYTCPNCQGKIDSVQVKAFENMLETVTNVRNLQGRAFILL
jgi:predicted methyltransferase